MRGRSYSYSPSPPPRGYNKRGRSRSPRPRVRYGSRGRDAPSSLLVRNLHCDCREPRGFGFVQFVYPEDAADAKHYLDGEILLGHEIKVVFAKEDRKKPSEMRARERSSSYDYRRTPLRYPRSPPRRGRAYSRSPDYYSPSPRRLRYSRSISPRDRKYRGRSYSRSPYRSRSRSLSYSRSRSRSP